ncbi:MAG: sigma-54 dependent transcriptional regulator, partial [Bacteroidota bacterium]
FESELFGHRKGAFTGATTDREGLFKTADGGTLFLDEVSEIPLHLQVKLLRAIEQKEITPVGATDPVRIDVRIISATNCNLAKMVDEGKFRDDLFYRLNVVDIHLPALSERKEDIPLLVQYFIKKYCVEMNKNVSRVDNEVMQILVNYPWRGEVRELENVIERAMIFCQSSFVTVRDLPDSLQERISYTPSPGSANLKAVMRDLERNFIAQQLRLHGYNKDETARTIGVNLSTLYRKIDELEIPSETQQESSDSPPH